MDETATVPNENDPEFQLTKEFIALTAKKKALAAEAKTVSEKLDDVEARLMRLLDDQNKKATSRYNGLGYVTCVDPTPYASIKEGQEDILFGALKEIGRDDLIKTSVNTRSLTTFVRERLKQNLPLPEGCTYYMERRLQFYAEK